MFQPGISGNPHGRPKGSGSGRAQTLATLDRMLAKAGNQHKLEQALEAELDANPVTFFRTLVVPLITREAPPPDANADWLPLDRTPPPQSPAAPAQPGSAPASSPAQTTPKTTS